MPDLDRERAPISAAVQRLADVILAFYVSYPQGWVKLEGFICDGDGHRLEVHPVGPDAVEFLPVDGDDHAGVKLFRGGA